jgi:hypothetical protein
MTTHNPLRPPTATSCPSWPLGNLQLVAEPTPTAPPYFCPNVGLWLGMKGCDKGWFPFGHSEFLEYQWKHYHDRLTDRRRQTDDNRQTNKNRQTKLLSPPLLPLLHSHSLILLPHPISPSNNRILGIKNLDLSLLGVCFIVKTLNAKNITFRL